MKSDPRRALTQQTYALVLAGGRGTRLRQLTDHRAKPAVPFAGTMRIIDFALGNCVNSGLRRVGVLTQYKAQSLIRHLHAFVREAELTEAEWFAGIQFLTATGQKCDDKRQEFILQQNPRGKKGEQLAIRLDFIQRGESEVVLARQPAKHVILFLNGR